MAKQKKQLEYAYAADPNKFNLRFYQRYDENFLFNKALTLAVVLANAERFKAQVAEYQDIDPNRVDNKFFESLQAELHFTEMHQFEGFFCPPHRCLPRATRLDLSHGLHDRGDEGRNQTVYCWTFSY